MWKSAGLFLQALTLQWKSNLCQEGFVMKILAFLKVYLAIGIHNIFTKFQLCSWRARFSTSFFLSLYHFQKFIDLHHPVIFILKWNDKIFSTLKSKIYYLSKVSHVRNESFIFSWSRSWSKLRKCWGHVGHHHHDHQKLHHHQVTRTIRWWWVHVKLTSLYLKIDFT